jgi:hypothetical protein
MPVCMVRRGCLLKITRNARYSHQGIEANIASVGAIEVAGALEEGHSSREVTRRLHPGADGSCKEQNFRRDYAIPACSSRHPGDRTESEAEVSICSHGMLCAQPPLFMFLSPGGLKSVTTSLVLRDCGYVHADKSCWADMPSKNEQSNYALHSRLFLQQLASFSTYSLQIFAKRDCTARTSQIS